MELTQHELNNNSIISHNKSTIILQNKELKTPCFISPTTTKQLKIKSLDDINKDLIFKIISKELLNLIIIGTGDKVRFIHEKKIVEIVKLGTGIEFMNNSSACSSFNILLSDARALGLIIL